MADLILNVSAPGASETLDKLESSLGVVKSAASGLTTALGKLEEAAPKKLKPAFSEAATAMKELERGFTEMDKAFADFRPKVKEAEGALKGMADTAKTTGQTIKKDLGDAFSGVAGVMAKSASDMEGSQEKVQQSVRRTATAVKESFAAYDALGMKIATMSSSMGAAAGGFNTSIETQERLRASIQRTTAVMATQSAAYDALGVKLSSAASASAAGSIAKNRRNIDYRAEYWLGPDKYASGPLANANSMGATSADDARFSNFLLQSREMQAAREADMEAMRKYYQKEEEVALAATKTLAEAEKLRLSNFLLASKEKESAYAQDMAALKKYYQEEEALSAKRLNDSVARFKALEAESARSAALAANLAKNPTKLSYSTGAYSSIQGSNIGTVIGDSSPANGLASAIDNLKDSHKNLASAKAATADASGKVGTAFKILEDQSKNLHSAFRGLASGFDAMWLSWGNILPLLAGAALSHAIVEVVKGGAELEYQLKFVSELTSGAKISVEAFSEAMRGSMMSSEEGAKGLRALAQAGLDTTQALAILPDVMNLAVVGEMTMSQAALAATGIMHAFNLQIYDMGHVTDVLTKAAASSNISVVDMVESMKTASVVADQYHLKIEEVSSALAVLGKRNIKGSAGGTAVKTMVDDLAAPTAKAQAIMEKLNLSVYDATGNLVSMHEMVKRVDAALTGLSEKSRNEALLGIFEKRAAKGIAALMEDYSLFTSQIAEFEDKAKGFADNVRQSLGSTVSGQTKQAANEMSLAFDGAFEHTADSWFNLVSKFRDGVKSDTFKALVEDLSRVTLGIINNADVIGGALLVYAAWPRTLALVTSGYEALKLSMMATEAVSVASSVAMSASITGTAASANSLAAAKTAAATAANEAAVASTAFGAALSRILWPLAIMGAVVGAYVLLRDSIVDTTEAAEREHRTTNDVNEALERQIENLKRDAAALNYAAQAGLSYDEALRKINGSAKQASASTAKVGLQLAEQDLEKVKSATPGWVKSYVDSGGLVSRFDPDPVVEYKEALDAVALARQRLSDAERSADTTEAFNKQSRETDVLKDRERLLTQTQKLYADVRKADKKSGKDSDGLLGEIEGLKGSLRQLGASDYDILLYLGQDLDKLKEKFQGTLSSVSFGKDKKVPREQFDNTLTTIKSELAERERAIKESYDNEMKLLDLRHKGKLDSDATFMLESLQKTAEFERERNQVRDEESIKYETDYRERLARIEAMPDSLTKTNQKSSLDNDYIRYFDSLAASRKRDADAERVRLETISISLETENKKVSDSVDTYIDKMNAKTAAEAAMQDARRAVAGQSAEVVAAFEAETAARSAGNSELQKWLDEMGKVEASLTELTDKLEKKSAAGVKLSMDEREALMDLIEKYQVLKNAVGKVSEANEANAKTASVNAYAKSINDQTDKLAKDITKTLADGIMSAGKDGGAGLRKAIEDVLITRPFRIVVEAVLQPISNSIAQGIMGQSIGAGAAGAAGLQTVLNGAALAVSSFGNAAMETAAGVAGFSAELSSLSFTEAVSAGIAEVSAGSYAAGAGMMAGAAMPYVAAAIAAKSLFDSMQGSVTPTGTYLYGGNTSNGYKWGGRQDFAQSGGLFGGGDTKNSSWFDPQPAVAQYMSAVGASVITSVKDWAKAIGLSADAVDSYNKQIEVSIGGLDAKGMKEAIDKAFAGMADDIAQVNFGDFLLPLAKEGETLGATLQRLGTDLTTVNKAMETLQQPLYDISIEGARAAGTLLTSVGGIDKFNSLVNDLLTVNKALEAMGAAALPVSMQGSAVAEELIQVAGGLDKFSSSTAQYYQDMYTATERASVSSGIIDKAFSDLGQSTPKTKDEFRKLVEAQDLTTAAGRRMALSIIALEPAFLSVMTAADDARKAALADVGVDKGGLTDIVKKGLMSGNLKGVGTEFTDKLLQGVQDNLYGKVADSIVNSITGNMIGPIIDSIVKGEPLDKALASISLDNVKTQYQETVDNIAGIFNNAQVTSGIGQLRSAIVDLFNVPVLKIDLGPTQTAANSLTIGGDVSNNAEGGYITGPGSSTSDSIPAMLSNGEFVVKASSVAKYGRGFLDAVNAGALRNTVHRKDGDPPSTMVGQMSADDDTAKMLALMYGFVNNVAQSGYWQAGLIADSGAIDVSSVEKDSATTYVEVLKALGETFTATTLELEAATKGFDNNHKALYRETEAGKELIAIRERLTQVTKDSSAIEMEMLRARGDSRGAAVMQRTIDLQDVLAKKTAAQGRLSYSDFAESENTKAVKEGKPLLPVLTEREKSYQTQIVASADAIIGQYDKNAKAKSDIAIMAAQDAATKKYLDATQKVTDAQKAYATALNSSIKSLKDFLASLDTKATSGNNLTTLRATFFDLSNRAASGDTSAYDKLAPAAKAMLDASEKYSRTLQEYRRDEAAVRTAVSNVIGKAEEQLATLPSDVALAADPIKDAWKALQKATNEQTNASILMAAMGTDRAASEARIKAAEDGLAKQYEEAIANSPDYEALKKAFEGKTQDLITKKFMPDYDEVFGFLKTKVPELDLALTFEQWLNTAFPLTVKDPEVDIALTLEQWLSKAVPVTVKDPEVDIALTFSQWLDKVWPVEPLPKETDIALMFDTQVKAVLPTDVAGPKFVLSDIVADRVKNDVLTDNFAGAAFNLSSIATDRIKGDILSDEFAGKSFNLSSIATDRIKGDILSDEFAGKSFNLSSIATDRIKGDILSDEFAGKSFNLSSIATDRVKKDILSDEFAGKSFNLSSIATDRVKKDVLTDNFAGPAFSLANVAATKVNEILPVGMAGASFNAAQMMQTAIDRAISSSSASVTSALTASVTAASSAAISSAPSTSGYVDRARLDAINTMNARIAAAGGTTFFDASGNPTNVRQTFAKGTSYVPYDMTANIHQGEEITPRPYVDAQRNDRNQTNALLAQLIARNDALLAEIAQLRAPAKESAESNKRIANTLTRVTRDGNALLTTPA